MKIDLIDKKVWLLALPLILSNLSAPLLGLVDTAIVGHLNSPVFLASVALASNYFMLLYFSLNFLRMSTTGYSAQAKGSATPALIVLFRALFLAFVLSLIVIAINPFASTLALLFLNASDKATHFAQIYIDIRIFGAFATLANFVIIGFAIGLQKPKIALISTALMHTTNATLSYAFVYIWDFGVAGVATASVIAEYLGVLIGLFLLRSQFDKASIAKAKEIGILQTKSILELISVNADLFIRSALLLATLFFFTSIGARLGDSTLAANAVLISFLLIISNLLDAFANTAETLVGEAIGRRDEKMLRTYLNATLKWSLVVAFLLFVAFFAFGERLISTLTNIDEIREVATNYLFWIVILPFCAVFAFWFDGVFVGALMTRKMRNSMALSVLLFFAVFYAFEPYKNHALWCALNIFMLSRGVFMYFMWRNFRLR